MPVTIADDVLRQAGLTEREALIEIACRLFDADRIDKLAACRLCGLSRVEFESELTQRGLPWIRVDYDLREDLRTLEHLTLKS